MIVIPENLIICLITIIEWHLDAYVPEVMFNLRLERILDRLYGKNKSNGVVQVEETDLYFINECLSNAKNNLDECGVEEPLVQEAYDWVVKMRKGEIC